MAGVLASLKKAGRPCDPRQVIVDLSNPKGRNLDEWSVRKAIWKLTADAAVELTPDWKLKLRLH
jgi:hypothetical protein